MLRNLRIGPRLLALIAIQVLLLLAVGVIALVGLDFAARSTAELNRSVSDGTRLNYVADTVRSDLIGTLRRVRSGTLGWEEGLAQLRFARRQFEDDWAAFTEGLTPEDAEFADDVLGPGLADVRQAFLDLVPVFEARDGEALSRFLDQELDERVEPFLNALLASSAERQIFSERTFAASLRNNRLFLYSAVAAVALGVILSAVLGYLIYRSITVPIGRIAGTVRQVAEGDYAVRTGVTGRDELGELAGALDALLEDKVTTLVKAEQENERLNDSVFRLLEAVSRLSERDLTVSVPVTPDVTGPVADAINQMAEETGRVLLQVQRIANQVGAACATVNKKATVVNESALAQQAEVERAANELAQASETLSRIAGLAREANTLAGRTSTSTNRAMQTVTGTLESMNHIREAIQETGKRIKRLGERSQEITTVVDIINTIAERTHMLAVNASMQAAAAGEAGRGFAVVAEEVQRLAESSREATAQIGSLVKNIQVDTNDTVVTMDRTITQVVEGSHMAEAAGEQMAENRETTERLVGSVREIAAGSEEQARISAELRERAAVILERSRATSREVGEQLAQTNNLVKYARALLQAVRVFKLPAREAA